MITKDVKLIPTKHYNFLKDYFKDYPDCWEEVKDDYNALSCWAKTLKGLGKYNVD